jgi:hypothetical protein
VRLVVILTAGLAACASASWAQDGGACVTARVPEAFTLPDGSVHPAGRLTLCALEAFTPARELHSVSVDGTGVGLAMSRRAVPEAYVDTRPAFLFRRAPDGVIDLVGYVVLVGGKSWSYTMNHSDHHGWSEPGSIAATRTILHTVSVEKASKEPKG